MAEHNNGGRAASVIHLALTIATAFFSLAAAWISLEFRANLAEVKLELVQAIEASSKETFKTFATHAEVDRIEARVSRWEGK